MTRGKWGKLTSCPLQFFYRTIPNRPVLSQTYPSQTSSFTDLSLTDLFFYRPILHRLVLLQTFPLKARPFQTCSFRDLFLKGLALKDLCLKDLPLKDLLLYRPGAHGPVLFLCAEMFLKTCPIQTLFYRPVQYRPAPYIPAVLLQTCPSKT